jgi:hypothetical protein
MRKILIVGAGPSAYVAALTCLEFESEIYLLNPKITEWENTRKSHLLRKLILKKRKNEKLFVHPSSISKLSGKNVDVFENFCYGGLSELWGGVFLPPITVNHKDSSKNTQDRIEAIEFIEKNIDISNKNSEIYKSYKNGGSFNKILKGFPSMAQSSEDKNQNWSSKQAFEKGLTSQIKFIDAYLCGIEQTHSKKVNIKAVDRFNKEIRMTFDKVFISAGVYGSARILLENLPELSSIQIEDSASSVKLGISKDWKNRNSIPKFMYPDEIYSKRGPDGKILKFTQVYKISEELIDSIKIKIIGRILKGINFLILKRLRLVMSFYPSSISRGILVFKEKDLIKVKSLNENNHTTSEQRKDIFDKSSILKITPEIYLKPGAGVHSGAFKQIDKENNLGRISKDIMDWPDIHFLGSSSITEIPAGPIMFGLMVNSRVIVKNAMLSST